MNITLNTPILIYFQLVIYILYLSILSLSLGRHRLDIINMAEVLTDNREILLSNIDYRLISEEDFEFEKEILRNPLSIKSWLRYIEHKEDDPIDQQVFVFERACMDLPRSYKLWRMYLSLRKRHVEGLNPAKYEEEYEKVNICYEKALVLLNKVFIYLY